MVYKVTLVGDDKGPTVDTTPTVRGVVTDEKGPVAGKTVTILKNGVQATTVVTDSNGAYEYTFGAQTVGLYGIEARVDLTVRSDMAVLNVFASGGENGGLPPVPDIWWDTNPLMRIQIQEAKNRARINGVTYTNLDDVPGLTRLAVGFVIADTSAWINTATGFMVKVVGVAPATSATEQYVFAFDDGDDGVIADELFRLGYQSNNIGRMGLTRTTGSASDGALTRGSELAGNRFAAAVGIGPTAYRMAVSGGTIISGAATPPVGITRLTVRNRADGIRPYNRVLEDFIIYANAPTDAEAIAASAVPTDYSVPDFGYSWWIKEVAIQTAAGVVVTGMKAQTADQAAFLINPATKAVIGRHNATDSVFAYDDHNAIAAAKFGDGRLCELYTGHGQGTNLRFRKSTDGSPVNMGSEVVVFDYGTGTVSYSQLIVHSSGLFAITQFNDQYWDVFFSADEGATWTRKKRLVNAPVASPQQLYMWPGQLSTNVLRYFLLVHPNNTQNPLRTFDLNLSTGDVSNGGVSLGNINDATPGTPIIADQATLPAILTPTTARSQRLLDVSSDGLKFLVCDFVKTGGGDGKYLLGEWNGSGYTMTEIVASGTPFWSDSNYFGGCVFAGEAVTGLRLYLSRKEGSTWYIERRDRSLGGVWTTTVIASSTTLMLIRPVSPVDGDGQLPVIWQECSFYDTYTAWGMDTVWQR